MACFTGNIFFMSYQALLTSEMSVKKIELPFQNIVDLFHSEYNLYVWKNNGILENSVRNPVNGSPFVWASEKLKQNPDENSFLTFEAGFDKVVNGSTRNAFFVKKDLVHYSLPENVKCEIKTTFDGCRVQVDKISRYNSIAYKPRCDNRTYNIDCMQNGQWFQFFLKDFKENSTNQMDGMDF